MLISKDVSGDSPAFSIQRGEGGVTLNLSYTLAEDSAAGDGDSAWNGELNLQLGDDTASSNQTSEGPLQLSFDSELSDGVTYEGSYTLTDHSDGTELIFDFTLTSFLQEGEFQGQDAADYVVGSDFADVLSGGAGNDVFSGGAGADELNGDAGDDRIYGGQDDDLIDGGTGDDRLKGNRGDDTVKGGDGDDWLQGRLGNDVLVGGEGADRFMFFTALGHENADTIEDFVSGEDQIVLGSKVFTALAGLEGLDGMNFVSNETGEAAEADDRIVYNSKTGELFYDADGSGEGEALLIATLKPGTDLNEGDFLIV